MNTDHRLQIHMPKEGYQALREKAHAEGKSLGAVVREAIASYVTQTEKDRIREGYKRFSELVGLFRGPDDGVVASEEHDRLVADAVEEEYRRKTDRRPES
jgi:hypothetical protein